MAWSCPKCGRNFRVRNQSHSCEITGPEHHFTGKDPRILEIFVKIKTILDGCSPVNITYVKNAIIISAKSTFLAVKPKKKLVDIEFLLQEETLEFPIYKTVRASKHKIAHFIKAESPEEIDATVAYWLQKAYRLNVGKEVKVAGR